MKKNPKHAARQFEKNELPEIMQKYNIRVSAPYGAYPEDVVKVVQSLEDELRNVSKDNLRMKNDLEAAQKDLSTLQEEFVALKMSVSLMEIPDVSAEESMVMLNKMSGITDNFKEETPVYDEAELERRQKNKEKTMNIMPVINNKPTPSDNIDSQQSFNNLIKPRKPKPNGGNK